MKSIALTLLGNRSDAEDAVHDAFVKAYRARAEFRQHSQLYTWVYRILLNTCRDMGRRKSVRRVAEDVDSDIQSLDVTGPGTDPAVRLALRRALGALPDHQRDVFMLCEVEGLTHREAGEVLGIPEGTSKSRLSEARRQLKAALWGGVDEAIT